MDQHGSTETADVPRKSRRGWIVLIIIAALLVAMVPVVLVPAALVLFRYSEPVDRYELEPSDVSMKVLDISPWKENLNTRAATERLKLTLSVVSVHLVKRAEAPAKLAGSLGSGKELLAIKLKLKNSSKGRILDRAKLDQPTLRDNFGNWMGTAPGRTDIGEIKPGNATEFTAWAVPPRVPNATSFRGRLVLMIWFADEWQTEELKFSFKSSDIQDQQGVNP